MTITQINLLVRSVARANARKHYVMLHAIRHGCAEAFGSSDASRANRSISEALEKAMLA